MKSDEIARLRELEGKATKGEWDAGNYLRHVVFKGASSSGRVCECRTDDDAEFIAALRNAAPALIADSKRLEQIRQARSAIESARQIVEFHSGHPDDLLRQVLALLDADETGDR